MRDLILKWWIKTLKYAAIYILLIVGIFFINLFVLHIAFVPSESMEPTIRTNSLVISTRYDINKIERNDVITFWQNGEILIKRVIGLPNETVSIRDNEVYINDKHIKCSYLKEKMITKNVTVKIPKNELFVMGDNRNNSSDSRVFGTIKKKEVIARSKIVLLPVPRKIQ